jgi:hypothetical protein
MIKANEELKQLYCNYLTNELGFGHSTIGNAHSFFKKFEEFLKHKSFMECTKKDLDGFLTYLERGGLRKKDGSSLSLTYRVLISQGIVRFFKWLEYYKEYSKNPRSDIIFMGNCLFKQGSLTNTPDEEEPNVSNEKLSEQEAVGKDTVCYKCQAYREIFERCFGKKA